MRMQRENRVFFDEDIGDDIEALINQIVSDHLQDIEDVRAIQRIKEDPKWRSKCTRIGDVSDGIR